MSTRHFWSDFSVFQWRTGITILYYLSTIIFLIYRIDIRCVLTGSMLTSDGNLLPSGGGCRLSDSDDFCQLAGKCFILFICHLRNHYLNPLHPTKKNNWTRLIYKINACKCIIKFLSHSLFMHCRYKRQISYLKSYLAYRVTSALFPKPKMALFARDSSSLLSMNKISLKGKPNVNNQSVYAYPDIHSCIIVK